MPFTFLNSVELSKVLLFVKENKSKIYIGEDKIGKYPIDREQVNKMLRNIDVHSNLSDLDKENTKKFVERIVSITRYVDFSEYLSVIHKICCDIERYLLNNHDKYKKIFISGYGPITKSYTWVLFLFLDKMNNFFEKNPMITHKILVGDDAIEFEVDNTDKYLLLFFDDMSYSGLQMHGSIPSTRKSNNVDIFISAPFISETARGMILSQNSGVKFWPNTEIVPSLGDLFFKDLPASEISVYSDIYVNFCINRENTFYNTYQCHQDMIPIYFDHKIADGVSTFQKLLYFGVYPIINDDAKCVLTPLIKSCIDSNIENKDNILKGTYADITNVNHCKSLYVDIPNDFTCPETFYKKLVFNFSSDKEPIPCYSDMTLSEVINYYDSIGKFDMSGGFKKKYIKYKNKYLNLKKLIGGHYDINIILNECLSNKYKLIKKLETNERGGAIYIVQNESGEELILKSTDSSSEYDITIKASLLGIGPIVYDHCVQGKYTFIVMKKYNYQLKQRVLDTNEKPNYKRIIEVFKILHSNNILHNDASTSNWMFNNSDMSDLVLIDFGDSEINEKITPKDMASDVNFMIMSLQYSAKLDPSKIKELIDYKNELIG